MLCMYGVRPINLRQRGNVQIDENILFLKRFSAKTKKRGNLSGVGGLLQFLARVSFVMYVLSLTNKSEAKPFSSLPQAFQVICIWVLNSRIFTGTWVLKSRGSTRYTLVTDHTFYTQMLDYGFEYNMGVDGWDEMFF